MNFVVLKILLTIYNFENKNSAQMPFSQILNTIGPVSRCETIQMPYRTFYASNTKLDGLYKHKSHSSIYFLMSIYIV